MDVGIININEWYEWAGAYAIGWLVSFVGAIRHQMEWVAVDGEVKPKLPTSKTVDPYTRKSVEDTDLSEAYGFAFTWPISLPAWSIHKIATTRFSKRIAYGKPPKSIKNAAHEQKVDKLLEEN